MKLKRNSGIAVYIHIPFCLKKCNYCDFVSFSYKRDVLKDYISCLIREINISSEYLGIGGISVSTVYFGGGTPSLLEPKDLEKIICALDKNFKLEFLSEFTIEANPETVEYDKFKAFKALGVNRVSMGAQSFNDITLKLLGRIHSSERIYHAFEILRETGFENINLDLMFALPGEKLKDTLYSLNEAIQLSPEHISYYSLTIEKGTEFYAKQRTLNLPDENLEYEEYTKGMEILLKNEFLHYEISNFAKRGYESAHNIYYWKNLPYVGFGVSAYSYLRRKRFGNFTDIKKYCKTVYDKMLPVEYEEKLAGIRAKAEHIMLNLRLLSEGLDSRLYYKRFGTLPVSDFGNQINKLKKYGLIKESDNRIILTHHGVLLANQVFTEFLP